MTVLENYHQFGGQHPETAALTNILAAAGLRLPHTDQPLSEAMVLGISGGLGAGYILYEFQEHRAKVLVLGFHNRWQYPVDYYRTTCDRLGIKASIHDFGGKKAAAQTLTDCLKRDTPVIAWVDRASMPYLQLPEGMIGHIGHIVAICGVTDSSDSYWIDDLAAQPFAVEADALAAARNRITSYKNRLLWVDQMPAALDLSLAIQQGIGFCVAHLSSPSDSFSLPTIRKWGKTMTDGKSKKGWLKVFEDRRGLFSTLRSIFENISVGGAPGGLRPLYAEFLNEAAVILENVRLLEAVQCYTDLGRAWSALAEEALPDDVPLFKEAKELLRERHHSLMRGGDHWQSTGALTDALRKISTEGNLAFPLDDAGVLDLFTRLQTRLLSIYEAEVQALAVLKDAAGIQPG